MQWDVISQKQILKTVPFVVEELHLSDKKTGPLDRPYHRLVCSDWTNVLAITPDRQAVLIRQSRAGCLSDTLEIPGGMVDPAEKDVMMAALRELEEETGFTSQRVLPLASINPNPAIQNNFVHMFLALNCQIPYERKHFPDPGEEISVELVAVNELETMVRQGQLNHALAALTIMLSLKYLGT